MSRKQARELLFKYVYSELFSQPQSLEFLAEDADIDDENLAFIQNIISLLEQNKQEISDKVQQHCSGYNLDRVFKVDKAILLIAVTELLFAKEVPANVVVNEAVELAKKFSTEKSTKFVNGVLSGVVKG